MLFRKAPRVSFILSFLHFFLASRLLIPTASRYFRPGRFSSPSSSGRLICFGVTWPLPLETHRSGRHLEVQLQGELQNAWRHRRGGYFTEARTAKRRGRICELRMVESIEELCPEIKGGVFFGPL